MYKQEPNLNNEGLLKLFEVSLKELYWIEKSLLRAIPKMIKNSTADILISALEQHLEVTEKQTERLETIFQSLDRIPRSKRCHGMEAIIAEGEELMANFESPILDFAIIIA